MATLTSVTAERLLREVRLTLKQPKAENSRWGDEELLNYCNDGIALYFTDINEAAEGQFDVSTTLDITSGSETIALPSDCFAVKALFRKLSNGESVPLTYRQNFTDSYDTTTATSSAGYVPYYYFRGNNIVLRPSPGFTELQGLTLEYTQIPSYMIYGGDSMTSGISPMFKELVVMYAVFKAKLADDLVNGSQTSAFAGQHLANLYAKFKAAIHERSKYPQFISPFIPS